MNTRESLLSNPGLIGPPELFGYKTAWHAVRSENPGEVAKALDLDQLRSVNWTYGINSSYEMEDYSVYVSQPLSGWVLATGVPILWEADDFPPNRLIQLSEQFGEAQLFASMRVSSAYIWARATDGNLSRYFYDVDGQHREEGERTKSEEDLGSFFDPTSPESTDPNYWSRKDLIYPDEQHVLKMAGAWSVDPSQLDQLVIEPKLGLLGKPGPSYKPKPTPIRRTHPKKGFLQRLFGPK